MKFLFWNIRENESTEEAIIALIKYEKPDVLLLAETTIKDEIIEKLGLSYVLGIQKSSFGINKKLRLYSTVKNLKPVTYYGDGEILVCSLEIKNDHETKDFLIFGCHFVSKSTLKDEGKRVKRFAKYKEFIESTERDFSAPPLGQKKNYIGAIVFGDFNTNPFEPAFTDSSGLFALDIRTNKPKKIKNIAFFINPTFSLLGNFNHNKNGKQAAPGTYFYHNKDIEINNEFFWNTIDGMIFRPILEEYYNLDEPLEIITSINDENGGIHHFFDFSLHQIKTNYSDHLPIKFNFNF